MTQNAKYASLGKYNEFNRIITNDEDQKVCCEKNDKVMYTKIIAEEWKML